MYRIFGIERLFQLINDQSLALLSPRKWEDPYEKALQDLLETKNTFKIYGLCWSLRSKSDALWRIYSPNKLGVRVSTTIGRFIDAVKCANDLDERRFFVGKVSYIPEIVRPYNKLYDFGEGRLSLDQRDFSRNIYKLSDAINDMVADRDKSAIRNPSDVAKTFLVKRKAFEHESEIRYIYVDGHNNVANDGVYKIKIDPIQLISTIQFDPRMKDDVYESLKKAIAANVAPHSIKITKSDLYKSPEKLISKI